MRIIIYERAEFAKYLRHGLTIYQIKVIIDPLTQIDDDKRGPLATAEESLAQKAGLAPRTIRDWKSATFKKRDEHYIDAGEAFLCLVAYLLLENTGWRVSDKSRIDWLVGLLSCTSLKLTEPPTKDWLLKLFSNVKNYAGKCFSHEDMETIQQLVLDSPEEAKIRKLKSKSRFYKDLGRENFRRADYPSATAYLRKSYSLAVKYDFPQLEAECLSILALILTFQHKFPSAYEKLNRALVIFKKLPDIHGEAYATRNLGIWYEYNKDYEEAFDQYRKAREIAHRVGNLWVESLVLGDLGNEYARLQNWAYALFCYYRGLRAAIKLGDRYIQTVQLGNMANLYDYIQKYETSIFYYGQAVRSAHEIGDKYNEAIHLGNLGDTYKEKVVNYGEALKYFRQALKITRQIGDLDGELSNILDIAETYKKMGNSQHAREHYTEALPVARQLRAKDTIKMIEDELANLENRNDP